MLERGLGVPEPGSRVLDPQQRDVLAPGQFANDPLENCRVGPRRGERPHIAQIGRREAARIGELRAQVGGEPVDHLGAPAVRCLAFANVVADLPIEADQLAVHGEGGAQPRLANPGFQVGEPGGVPGGRPGRHRAALLGADPPGGAARPGCETRRGRRAVWVSGLIGSAASSMHCALAYAKLTLG